MREMTRVTAMMERVSCIGIAQCIYGRRLG